MKMEHQNIQQEKNTYKSPKSKIGGRVAIVFLSITSIILLYFLISTQYKLDFETGKFDAALDTIREKNEELKSFQSKIEVANSSITALNSDKESLISEIDSLNSQIESLNSETESLNSKLDTLNSEKEILNSRIESLSRLKATRVDVINNNCNNVYVFIDGRLAAGTRASGTTYFYVPHGSYEIQACGDPYRSNCGSSKTATISTEVFTWTITKHSSCP